MLKRLLFLLISIATINASPWISSSSAAVVSASGTNATVCNQTVSDSTNVEAVRLAGGDCVISFKSGTVDWTAPLGISASQILLVGGGGGGGGTFDTRGAGGGGAGQVNSVLNFSISGSSVYSITVGAKGTGGSQTGRTNAPQNVGINGGNSLISLGGSNQLIAYGGLGGCASRTTTYEAYCTSSTDNATGGSAATTNSGGGRGGAGGGGGGGSSGTGGAGVGGAGGTGTAISITGTSVTYGIGGSGGLNNSNAIGTSASPNTGSGGRGASSSGATYYNGGDGGSGIVIIRFTLSTYISTPTFSGEIVKGNLATVSVKVNMQGKVRFFLNGKRIPGCISVTPLGAAAEMVATCIWKPSVSGSKLLYATLTPTDVGFGISSSAVTNLPVKPRTTTR